MHRDEKGQSRYEKFVADRLVDASPLSLWDRSEKLKLKTHITCVKKVSVVAGNKVMKLREDRQLLVRFLVIQQSRPNTVDKLGDTIGKYGMAVTLTSIFAMDRILLIPSDKTSFMKEVERYPPSPLGKLGNNHSTTAVCDHTAPVDPELHSRADSTGVHLGVDMLTEDVPEPPQIDRDNVIIIDGQAVVQGMTKLPSIDKIRDLGDTFIKRNDRLMKGYSEGRIIFDRYITGSLKEKTWTKRAGTTPPDKSIIQDSMYIHPTVVPCYTKSQLTEYLGKKLLEHFAMSEQGLVVFGTTTYNNKDNIVNKNLSTHSHEEADTNIPLHVIDNNTRHINLRYLCVVSRHRCVSAADGTCYKLHNTSTRSSKDTNRQRKVLPNK